MLLMLNLNLLSSSQKLLQDPKEDLRIDPKTEAEPMTQKTQNKMEEKGYIWITLLGVTLLQCLACESFTFECNFRRLNTLFSKETVFNYLTSTILFRAFSLFGERGKFIISGGNDKSVKVWDWSRYLDTEGTSSGTNVLQLNINLSKKVSSCIF